MGLEFRNVNHTYNPGTTVERHALKDISFTLEDGEYLGLIGHTGSGKSTLIQHMNGLLKADSGDILYDGQSIYDKSYSMNQHHFKVGMVFQYPEHQLFETTVLKDVCFGPGNMGLSEDEAVSRAKEALKLVELPEIYWDKSPFILSGGQKRRAAIAGVIAMDPKILIMDEPAAGLDPEGRDSILESISMIRKERGITVVLVSHNMDDVAKYATRVLVLNKGSIYMDGTPKEVFSRTKELYDVGLSAPGITVITERLKSLGIGEEDCMISMDDAADMIAKSLRKG